MSPQPRLASLALATVFWAAALLDARAAERCDRALGESAFALCSACHALDTTSPQREGPHLAGIIGRPAASLTGFGYSEALRSSGWVWSKDLLEKYIAAPQRVLPGTSMTFVGIKSAEERKALSCYLEEATRAVLAPARAPGVAPAPENTGPNTSIVRRAAGVYLYETIKERRRRGEEHFQLLVHPDASRTLIIWHDLAARNAQFTVVLRVAESFRPLESYVSYWTGGQFKGSATFRVNGARLEAVSDGPSGPKTAGLEVPERFSIGAHPVAGDGWHTWGFDAAGAAKQTLTLYGLEASADLTKPVLGTLQPLSIERVGAERITVPAGRFETVHYRLMGINDIWITERDRLMIKSVIPGRDLQYVLTKAEGDF